MGCFLRVLLHYAKSIWGLERWRLCCPSGGLLLIAPLSSLRKALFLYFWLRLDFVDFSERSFYFLTDHTACICIHLSHTRAILCQWSVCCLATWCFAFGLLWKTIFINFKMSLWFLSTIPAFLTVSRSRNLKKLLQLVVFSGFVRCCLGHQFGFDFIKLYIPSVYVSADCWNFVKLWLKEISQCPISIFSYSSLSLWPGLFYTEKMRFFIDLHFICKHVLRKICVSWFKFYNFFPCPYFSNKLAIAIWTSVPKRLQDHTAFNYFNKRPYCWKTYSMPRYQAAIR